MKKINSNLFKITMSKFATGVTIITVKTKDRLIGKTINSFTSVSLNPPLILFSLDKNSTSLKDYYDTKYVGINILSKDQIDLSNYFSIKKPQWKDTKHFFTKNKIPMIKNSVANISCKNIEKMHLGDHIIFVCKIIEVKIDNKKKPLIYLNSKYI